MEVRQTIKLLIAKMRIFNLFCLELAPVWSSLQLTYTLFNKMTLPIFAEQSVALSIKRSKDRTKQTGGKDYRISHCYFIMPLCACVEGIW